MFCKYRINNDCPNVVNRYWKLIIWKNLNFIKSNFFSNFLHFKIKWFHVFFTWHLGHKLFSIVEFHVQFVNLYWNDLKYSCSIFNCIIVKKNSFFWSFWIMFWYCVVRITCWMWNMWCFWKKCVFIVFFIFAIFAEWFCCWLHQKK